MNAKLVLTAPVRGSVLAPPRVQLAKALLARSAVKLTVQLGGVAEVGVLSVTVAVQLLGLPTGTRAGEQLTAVLVSCMFTVTVVVPELRSEERRVGKECRSRWSPYH